MIISSRTNPIVQTLRDIRDGKSKKHLFCEGEKIIRDVLASNIVVDRIFCLEEMETKALALVNGLKTLKPQIVCLSEQVMKHVSDLTTPPGMIALAVRPKFTPQTSLDASIKKNSLILFLHDIQLPQNVGALFRTAEAAGVTAVWMTSQCGDPFGPKAIRASAGCVFRVPVSTNISIEESLKYLKTINVQVLAAVQKGRTPYDEINWGKPSAIIVGSEGKGLSADLINQMDNTVTIPMKGQVESLNVGIAAAVCLFEAAKQRRSHAS